MTWSFPIPKRSPSEQLCTSSAVRLLYSSNQKTTALTIPKTYTVNNSHTVLINSMIRIIPMLPSHWQAVAAIYQEGIDTGCATFETSSPKSFESWDTAHMSSCRFVAVNGSLGKSVEGVESAPSSNDETVTTEETEEVVMGWAALSPVSSRCVYGGVAEVSVYVGQNHRGKGVGTQLLQKLIESSEGQGIWTLQSGIFPENEGSIALHKHVGFRYIGTRERIGKLKGVWKDNVLFERRSKVVGL